MKPQINADKRRSKNILIGVYLRASAVKALENSGIDELVADEGDVLAVGGPRGDVDGSLPAE
jgi:hypothetical protein